MIRSLPTLHVVAGVLNDADGRVLICQRPPGKHMADAWEFPGGKLDPDESRLAGLDRELSEELGLRLLQARPLIRYRHVYPDREIDLDVWRVLQFEGQARGLEGQALDWVAPGELDRKPLLPADRPILSALALGSLCAVTGRYEDLADFRRRVARVLERGATLLQLRAPWADQRELGALAAIAIEYCRPRAVPVVINGEPDRVMPVVAASGADGIHLPVRCWRDLTADAKPAARWVGMSCHDREELAQAVRLGADYAVLGPVLATASHPGAPGIGWGGFAELTEPLPLPVYAIGGMVQTMLEPAWRHGAQGLAAISALWE